MKLRLTLQRAPHKSGEFLAADLMAGFKQRRHPVQYFHRTEVFALDQFHALMGAMVEFSLNALPLPSTCVDEQNDREAHASQKNSGGNQVKRQRSTASALAATPLMDYPDAENVGRNAFINALSHSVRVRSTCHTAKSEPRVWGQYRVFRRK